MECSKCPIKPLVDAFVLSNLPSSLNRYKSVEIHSLVNTLCEDLKSICLGCNKNERHIKKLADALRTAFNEKSRPLFDAVLQDKIEKKDKVEVIRESLSKICLTCSHESNDDNPSNKGQQFYSLDSGFCRSSSGKSSSTHSDDNDVVSRADWIALHADPIIEDRYTLFHSGDKIAASIDRGDGAGMTEDAHSITSLPEEIEDLLRQEASILMEFPLQDKLLLACVLSGFNLTQFADLKWIPACFRDAMTGGIRPITKQAIHSRWNQMVKKAPYLQLLVQTRVASKKNINFSDRDIVTNGDGEEEETKDKLNQSPKLNLGKNKSKDKHGKDCSHPIDKQMFFANFFTEIGKHRQEKKDK